ncbi:M20/M25/M40 family metallo-hydrolase [Aneurinibacillus sp. Ricciae_BoGa-3]|uniref:M20/M25/M40 family metallo-hydrolase n=1 Tax=Aneurinibacillus sp. Ricciae_BoGa-3 TaxID=3022697 RepID=UPI0023420E11|nr:M20/M25/M40 family metallo-hydrolase [Aneurinibacillus sp. Ricciae_BoGa-3]WCK55192.1 M20/M25/M40 family metallo-hydrolase [Aneurinibacillus sp. Ricciae_BoGa-3]
MGASITGKWQTKKQKIELLSRLVAIPSITGSEAEIAIADFIQEELRAFSYFQENRDHLKLHSTGDGRNILTALVKKHDNVKNTVILVSHFDVVDIQDYGRWSSLAFDTDKLTEAFYMRKADVPLDVQQDIDQGNWLFGRGTMDMKCGIVSHMSIIEQATLGAFDGNVLMLAVCDEEANSVGMREAVPVLLDMAEKHQLDYKVCLNSEPMFARYPGDAGKYIYTGSIGKVLPGFLCYGKETHVGEPLSGLNASYMASQITSELELNTAFCEVVDREVMPPPTNLLLRDLKEEYSVQIPHRAVALFNLFLFEKSMDEIVDQLRCLMKTAAACIEQHYAKQAGRFAQLAGCTPETIHVNVLTFDELMAYAVKTYGQEEMADIQAAAMANREECDDREATIRLVDKMAILCKELAPMIVMFFAPPYYPPVSSRMDAYIQSVVDEMIRYAKKKHDVVLYKQNYFAGISDLSYTGLSQPISSLHTLISNMPLWGKGYTLPLEELRELNLPVLNIGPVGRDAHKWTERLDVDYAFETLVDMLTAAINLLFR